MKKLMLTVFVATALLATSCKKERTCTCTYTQTPATGTATTSTTTYKMTKISKRIAEENCYNKEYTSGTGSFATTYKQDCKLD